MPSKHKVDLSKFFELVGKHDNASVFRNISDSNKQLLYEKCWQFIKVRKGKEAILKMTSVADSKFLILNMPDMPFIVDSVRMALSRLKQEVRSFINIAEVVIERSSSGEITGLEKGDNYEALLLIELSNSCDISDDTIIENLQAVVKDVSLAVCDWHDMQAKMTDCIDNIKLSFDLTKDQSYVKEAVDFIVWLKEHFTFFGFRSYMKSENGGLQLDSASSLGVLREKNSTLAGYAPSADKTPYEANTIEEIVCVGKSKYQSTIHRLVYTDVIVLRLHDKSHKFIGEYRFFGLFTSNAYESDPMVIPLLRHKSQSILERIIKTNLKYEGYTSKKVKQFIRSIPRDELFQADINELVSMVKSALALQSNTSIKVILRRDKFKRFLTAMLYLPQSNHTYQRCEKIANFLKKAYHADAVTYQTTLLDLQHVCVYFVLRTNDTSDEEVNPEVVRSTMTQMSLTWEDLLNIEIAKQPEVKKGVLTFTNNFKELFSPIQAVKDIKVLNLLSAIDPIKLKLDINHATGLVHIRCYQWQQHLTLSTALPIFENLGFELKHEIGAGIIGEKGKLHWLSEFTAKPIISIDENTCLLDGIINTFYKVLANEASNDNFNQLGLRSGLQWFEIRVIRALSNYLKQIGFSFGLDYISQTLNNYPDITSEIMNLFKVKFSLDVAASTRESLFKRQLSKVSDALESVMYVDEDKIFRSLISLIQACVRTNAYKLDKDGKRLSYVSFKIHSVDMQDMPLPAPKFEIFTFSHAFMGAHLRADMVARGGLRWSDREDFRKEVLDLMKAQQVKNSVIVPAGAKGGFVLRKNTSNMSVKDIHAEAVDCYKNFIRSLLDLTDNLVGGKVASPSSVVCHDGPDYYLVAAADKGTSTFSDKANNIAEFEYDFWLKDAFATGGSNGYDHKKMGITSRGAWESFLWHSKELPSRIDENPFTVVGIGGMAGDVFGNGMLLSNKIKLVAAFNHKFIFLDPNPDPALSYKERQRLFELPDSMWSDYDSSLISEGGGIYSRFDKSIPISKEVKQVLGLNDVDRMVPTDLIKCLLRAPVDLIWNGGIGTYVKSKSESDLDVGDHSNDKLRINGMELRCKIFAEGGNLGMTQLGRTEADFAGVRLNTDFIDNSAGVDCSDHEVIIKILLTKLCDQKALTKAERDKWLAKMTNEVADLVLSNNRKQNLAISIASGMLPEHSHLFESFIEWAVSKGYLDRVIEFLPSSEELKERVVIGKSFSRAELSTLLSYSKIILQKEIIASDFAIAKRVERYVFKAFPNSMRDIFSEQIKSHPLRSEIIATQLSSDFVQCLGITFVPEVVGEVDVKIEEILSAFLFVKEFFSFDDLVDCLTANESKLPHDLYMKIWQNLRLLMRRSTRWILRNNSIDANDDKLLNQYLVGKSKLSPLINKIATGYSKAEYNSMCDLLSGYGLSKKSIELLSGPIFDFSALNIIDSALKYKAEVLDIAKVHFLVFEKLKTDLLRTATSYNNFSSRWSVMSRFKLKGIIDELQRDLTGLFYTYCYDSNISKCKKNIEERHGCILQNWQKTSVLLQPDSRLDFEVLYVMISELQKFKLDVKSYYE